MLFLTLNNDMTHYYTVSRKRKGSTTVAAQYFTEFIFYSFLGWIWESIYCTMVEKRWADRGFMFGPVCPIYGSCVVGFSLITRLFPQLQDPDFPLWEIFLLAFVSSAVIEFSTSWVLEQRFHARWWDYSDMPLNFHGRICLPASTGFGLAGIAVVKFLIPAVERIHSVVPGWCYEISAIILAFIMGVDLALTEASLSSLLKNVEDMHAEFNDRAQTNYERIVSAPKAIGRKIHNVPYILEERFISKYTTRLTLGQKKIMESIKKITPDRNKSQEQNQTREIIWHNLKNSIKKIRPK